MPLRPPRGPRLAGTAMRTWRPHFRRTRHEPHPEQGVLAVVVQTAIVVPRTLARWARARRRPVQRDAWIVIVPEAFAVGDALAAVAQAGARWWWATFR